MRHAILAILLMALPLSAQDGKGNPPKASTKTIAPVAASPTAGIQEAIDALGAGGGIIALQPAEYLLRRSIQIRSNVTLQGAGPKTVLRKLKQVEAKLVSAAAPENRSLRVENAAGFREGDEIGVFDQGSVGWLNAHAIVKGI